VVFFFLTAQAISWLAFQQIPSLAVLVGGLFIVTGGIIIAIPNT
jgi:drug/metabolite transporter (DMT)-like permease